MSYVFESDGEVVWSPALRVGQVFEGFVTTLSEALDQPSGFPRNASDHIRIDHAAFATFVLPVGGSCCSAGDEPFRAIEVPDAVKEPILREYLRRWKLEVGQFFGGVGADSPADELARIAPAHPVFRIETEPHESRAAIQVSSSVWTNACSTERPHRSRARFRTSRGAQADLVELSASGKVVREERDAEHHEKHRPQEEDEAEHHDERRLSAFSLAFDFVKTVRLTFYASDRVHHPASNSPVAPARVPQRSGGRPHAVESTARDQARCPASRQATSLAHSGRQAGLPRLILRVSAEPRSLAPASSE